MRFVAQPPYVHEGFFWLMVIDIVVTSLAVAAIVYCYKRSDGLARKNQILREFILPTIVATMSLTMTIFLYFWTM